MPYGGHILGCPLQGDNETTLQAGRDRVASVAVNVVAALMKDGNSYRSKIQNKLPSLFYLLRRKYLIFICVVSPLVENVSVNLR